MSAGKAYQVVVKPWGPIPVAITAATSRGKAHARNLSSAQDVGYKLKWGDLHITRAPKYDHLIEREGLFSWDINHPILKAVCITPTPKGGNGEGAE